MLAWYAVQVRVSREESVTNQLVAKGYETYLPRYVDLLEPPLARLHRPLYPGYVFCRADLRDVHAPVLMTHGVLRFVGNGHYPIAIEDSELTAVRRIAYSHQPVRPCPYLQVGERVRIVCGCLSGIEGILASLGRVPRVVVSISLLLRSVAVEVDSDWLAPIGLAPLRYQSSRQRIA